MKRSIGREKLANVLRAAGDLVTVRDAAESLGVSRQAAAKTLWSWSQQGWFTHVRRGLYAPIPPDSLLLDQVLPEPWILVTELFDPAYVGGWSAAERWEMTDQILRSVLVYTTRTVRPREQTIQGTPFVLKRTKPDNIFGVRSVWFGTVKVQVSDPIVRSSTCCCGGGIRHVNDCLTSYLTSEQADMPSLIEYAGRLGNGAVFKRLGFLLSRMDVDEEALEECSSRLTAGNAKLDPALPCRRLIKGGTCLKKCYLETHRFLEGVFKAPSPLAGEGWVEGCQKNHPHLNSLPSRERRGWSVTYETPFNGGFRRFGAMVPQKGSRRIGRLDCHIFGHMGAINWG